MKKHCAVSKKPKCSRTRGLSAKEMLAWRDKTKVWQQVSCFFCSTRCAHKLLGAEMRLLRPGMGTQYQEMESIPGGFWIRCMAAFMKGTSHYSHFTSSCSARQDGVFTFFCYRLFTPRFMSRGGFCLADKSRPPPHTAVAGGMGGGLLFREL